MEQALHIDLSATRKKRIQIDGVGPEGDERILELNTADMNFVVRLRQNYPKLLEFANRVSNTEIKEEDTEEEVLTKIADSVESIDKSMRQLVDDIFDSNVSEICAPSGSMCDLFNGKFRFEYIIESLVGLYEGNMSDELVEIQKRLDKYTGKYTKGK